MQPVELLQRINTLHKTTFIFLEKYPDGEQGAFVVTDRLIGRWVLKWAPGAICTSLSPIGSSFRLA